VGKTRLTAEIARYLSTQTGHNALYLTGSVYVGSALLPFVERINGFAAVVEPFLPTPADVEVTRARCWIAVLEFFEQLVGNAPTLSFVDDAHWLDDREPDGRWVSPGHIWRSPTITGRFRVEALSGSAAIGVPR
jgi:hypothetical protein